MKPVLIIENSGHGLSLNESKSSVSEKKYVMNGIFTCFDEINRNQRVYTAESFVPHVSEMMKKKEWGVIYGEFDHPDVFDVSMKYVSHVVENAWFNKKDNRIDGEIRLLNTQYGKDAKAIVDDGYPLFVSSRAAGVTESNGHVQLKQLFTYDIVADPGFSAAKMNIKTLNESVGFSNENTGLIEVDKQKLTMLSEKYQKSSNLIFDLTDESDTNKLFNMNKNDMVTKKQLIDYSKYLNGEIKRMNKVLLEKTSMPTTEYDKTVEQLVSYNEKLQEQMDKMVGYLDYLSEKLTISYSSTKQLEKKTEKIVDYVEYIGENVDKNIEYTQYVAENVDKNIEYTQYVAEHLNKTIDYSEYIAEQVEKSIVYTEYLAEQVDRTIDYSQYIAESLEKNINYSEYIAENLETTIQFSEYLGENLDANIGYSEFIVEKLEKTIDYTDYISECVDKTLEYSNSIAESIKSGKINETKTADEFLKQTPIVEKKVVKKEIITEVKPTVKPIVEKVVSQSVEPVLTESKLTDNTSKENLSSKIDNLINEAKKREASKEQRPIFYEFLNPSDIKFFESQSFEVQEEIKVSLNESVGYYSRQDVVGIMKNVIEKDKPSPEQNLVNNMPEEVKPIWESCDAKTKKAILSQARVYDISTPELVEHFWNTRNFDFLQSNTSKILLESNNPFIKNDKLSEEEIARITKRFNHL